MKNEKDIDSIVARNVSAKLDKLKTLDPETLLSLPPYSEEIFETNGKIQHMGIYREMTESGEALIVAQCKNTHFLGIGNMYAEGFYVDDEKQYKEAREEHLWNYL